MGYRTKISAMIVMLAWASTSFAQESANEDQPKRDLFKTAAVVASAALVIVGGYKFIKHIDKKALREAVEEAHTQAEAAEQVLQEKLARARKQAEELRKANDILTTENDILTTEAEAAAIVMREPAEAIERGEALRQRVRSYDWKKRKLSATELRAIYDGQMATLKVEKAKKLVEIHKQYPDNPPPEDIATKIKELVERREILGTKDYNRAKQEFSKNYPRYVAIEELEAKHQWDLAKWHEIYDASKNLTNGMPVMQYGREFTDKMSAIIKGTPIATELSALERVGNLQEVVWRLDEGGFATEATAMKKLIEDVLTNAEIVSQDYQYLSVGATKPLLLEFDSGLRGVFKGDYATRYAYGSPAERDVAAYRFDQLIGLNAFPITVPRRIDGYRGSGSVQLFIDGVRDDFQRQYDNYTKLIGRDLPEADRSYAKSNTFTLLMLDGDGHFFNTLDPISGRTIRIDADQAFAKFVDTYSVDAIKKNIKNDQLYLDDDFIARLDSITREQLEAIFKPLFEKPEISEIVVSALHANIRNYVKAARELAE